MRYSNKWLCEKIERSEKVEFLFFWGHTAKNETIIDKSCFSQWYPSPFEKDGIVYATAEHWMMARKAFVFNDQETLAKIIAAPKPAIAKALGREVKNFDGDHWSRISYSIVVDGNFMKFSSNNELKRFLLQTNDKLIVEASPADAIWGIGLAQDHKDASNPFRWRGTNLLGYALMEVRDMLR
jgi:ribA/ribD-fused uncharacterized protein